MEEPLDFSRLDPDILLDLVLLASDLGAADPGPRGNMTSSSKTLDKISSAIDALQAEMKAVRRANDQNNRQIINLSRMQQKMKADETMGKILVDVGDLKETMECQASLIRRQRAELLSLGREVDSVRKINQNQRNDLKHISSFALNDVKNLKMECSNNLQVLNKEKTEVDLQSKELDMLRERSGSLQDEQLTLKSDLDAFKDAYKSQVLSLRKCIESITQELQDQRELSTDRIRSLEGGLNQMREDSCITKGHVLKLMDDVGERSNELQSLRKAMSSTNKSLIKALDGVKAEQAKERAALSAQLSGMESKMNGLTGEGGLDQDSLLTKITSVQESIQSLNLSSETRFSELHRELGLLKRNFELELEHVANTLHDNIQNESRRSLRIAENIYERMDELDSMYDGIEDRVFEIDRNRKNNLVFYGLRGDEDDPDECESLIKHVFNHKLLVTREIPLTKVVRIWNGPSFRGVKPIQVSFQLFKDKEEVMRKATQMLRGSNIYVTEDFSRKVRRHREELLRFSREIRSRDPTKRCVLRYDRLYVDHDVFLFNELEGRVEPVLMKMKRVPEGDLATLKSLKPKKSPGLPTSGFFSAKSDQGIQATLRRSHSKGALSKIPRWKPGSSRSTTTPRSTPGDEDPFQGLVQTPPVKPFANGRDALETLHEEAETDETGSFSISSVSSVELVVPQNEE